MGTEYSFKNPREVNEDVPEEIEGIILKAMETEKENRYNDFFDLIMDLRDKMGWFGDILSGIGDFFSDAVSGFFDIFSSSGDNNNRRNREQNNSRRNSYNNVEEEIRRARENQEMTQRNLEAERKKRRI